MNAEGLVNYDKGSERQLPGPGQVDFVCWMN